MEKKETVFISYAWGGPLAKKEWLRQRVINQMEAYGFPIFWDRDAIQYGQRTDDVIASALSARPINILCLCDGDYIKSSAKENSGLNRELKLIANIAHMESVRVIPVILDAKYENSLPSLLDGRLQLNLAVLYARGLELGTTLASTILGATQPEIASGIALQLKRADLSEMAATYIKNNPFTLCGNGITHEVRINNQLLRPPAWMYQSSYHWSDRALEDTYMFCPQRGIWNWHGTGGTSTGVLMFGIAIISALFPNHSNSDGISAIENCGKIIAEKILCHYRQKEPIFLDGNEIIKCILGSDNGIRQLEKLIHYQSS